MTRKRTFFERLTGAIRLDDEVDDLDLELDPPPHHGRHPAPPAPLHGHKHHAATEIDPYALPVTSDEEGELAVDVIETPDSVVVRAMIAGVRPANLEVQLSRESVTVIGSREEESFSSSDEAICRELYWGSFSRTVPLPAEVDIEQAVAKEKHGLLTLVLPKVDRHRKTKLSVKPE
ncbi:MAG TPA: Hsp20/alpha crystallin family protein [Candidatus Paceibacterota bacterium]|uniref:SHSP domain-containing protein n=1 Tax=Candidatus Sungbacteria bacterium RIFCSPLOWO2_01_FULL_59_16 TaxID=1802280 RepID=A0A1G2LC92_9BACT|nr:MAG: hypothetical protein A3B37_00020 [Candidatus Sungbacteria bacterium RIFCSPLOWO2_01_FULL_59_16]